MKYDIAIAGGGLAGLAIAIQSARAGYSVILFEKESYPHHKVCGEYISMESYDFLCRLGLKLDKMNLPFIQNLQLTSPSGASICSKLDIGGFGISRYKIDDELAMIAKTSGANILENTKVTEITFDNDEFTINTTAGIFTSKIAIAAFGKRSNLDVKWKRSFLQIKQNRRNNLIGIKYHVKFSQPVDTISLHNFEDGYCGISAVEDGNYCLCYLTSASILNRYSNSITELQEKVLSKNPHLQKIFSTAEFLWSKPETISQISLDKKSQVQDHVLMAGDAAGMITPLCGNGMSMALHSGKIAFDVVDTFLKNQSSRTEMEKLYAQQWSQAFSKRLSFGRTMQQFFGKVWLTNIFVALLKPFPGVVRWLIKKSHGERF